jgi:hypothetical protein
VEGGITAGAAIPVGITIRTTIKQPSAEKRSMPGTVVIFALNSYLLRVMSTIQPYRIKNKL